MIWQNINIMQNTMDVLYEANVDTDFGTELPW